MYKIFELHQIKLPSPEREVSRRDFIAETLSLLGDPEWNPLPRSFLYQFEIHKHRLGEFSAQICHRRRILSCAEKSLKHQIEVFGYRKTFFCFAVPTRLLHINLICSKSFVTLFTLD